MSDFICRLRRKTPEDTRLWICFHGRAILFFFFIQFMSFLTSCVVHIFCGFWIMKAIQQLPPDWCHMFPVLNVVCLFFPPSHHRNVQSSVSRKTFVFDLLFLKKMAFPATKNNCNELGIHINRLFFWSKYISKSVCLFVCVIQVKKIGPVI